MSVHAQPGVYSAPAIAARVLQFHNNGSQPPVVIVENLSPSVGGASAAIRFQESDNGVDWTDIPDTSATVMPGGESVQTVVNSSRARIALHAGGNVSLLVTVVRTIKGSPVDLGAA
jgi:hypothetical protein